MAGIGFKLRELLNNDSYINTLAAYGLAGVTSSGPWVLSILGILIVSLIGLNSQIPLDIVKKFQIIAVYLFAGSLIISGIFQHLFTHHIANLFYDKDFDQVMPSFNCAMLSMLLLAAGIVVFPTFYFFMYEPLLIKFLIASSFIILSMIWVAASTLSGMKAYRTIIVSFLLSTLTIMSVSYGLRSWGLKGILTGFTIGQFILLLGLIAAVYNLYPSKILINFDFFKFKNNRLILAVTGLSYNLGIWIDKFIFWYNPITGSQGFGPLHYSVVYDVPIFLAYFTIIPGLTSFLLKIETDFIDAYQEFYADVCLGGTFSEIRYEHNNLIYAARDAVFSVFKFQLMIILMSYVAAPFIFKWLNITFLYLPLFYILVVAAGLNVIFLGLLDITFYLNESTRAVILTMTFLVTNALFTYLSIKMGVFYYGYGLVMSLLVTNLLGFIYLRHDFKYLAYKTFMLQP